MSRKGGKTTKTPPFSHIASAIIPSVGIIAVPAAATHFPLQKRLPNEQWGPLAPTLLRAASASQLLVSSTISESIRGDRDQLSGSIRQRGRMDFSTDEEESDVEEKRQTQRKLSSAARPQSIGSPSVPLSNAERRFLTHTDENDDQDSSPTMRGTYSTARDPKEALVDELSRSTMKNDDRSPKKVSVTVGRQVSPLALEPLNSAVGPTSARGTSRIDGPGLEGKSVTTARSSLNESTTIPISARSVSFKEPVLYETYDPSSSHSQPTTAVQAHRENSTLEKIVLPPPEEYQHNYHELERRNQSLTVEVQQLRSNNQNLQKQYEELLDRLQHSQTLTKQELADILKQSGLDQAKDLEGLNNTLKERCNHLEDELIALRERYGQVQNQANIRELKNENHFLKDYIHRLNATISEYQAQHPPDALKETAREQRRTQGLPVKGPSPIWLLNRKFLAPLFVYYDEKIRDREDFIKKLQMELKDLKDQAKSIVNENQLLHQRLSRASAFSAGDGSTQISSDLDNIKRQAYLVLEENRVLQEQLDLHKNQLNDHQKAQIQEVSSLTRRLLIAEAEKTEADRALETLRLRNEDLRRKYEQLMLDNNHRIHVQEHVYEMSEMKRLTDELSEKHAHEMRSLLRRVQDSEAEKKVAQLKLTDCRTDLERLKGDLKAVKRANKKLSLRVQTFEKKLELQQVKEQRLTTTIEQLNEEFEQAKQERDTYFTLAKKKEEEMKEISKRITEDAEKINRLEEGLENLKNKNKDRVHEVQEQTRKQYENLKLRCLEYEQRIQQLMKLLNEKQVLVDDLNAEKRTLQVDLETIWQASNADNLRMREHFLDMRSSS